MIRFSLLSLGRSLSRTPGLQVFVFFAAIYLLTMGGHLYSADDEIKAMITEAIIERHSVALPVVDMAYMTVGRGGQSYSPFPVGASITMIPFYMTGRLLSNLMPGLPRTLVMEFCYGLMNPLVTAIGCAVFFLLCRRLNYSVRTALATTVIYGFCTITWPYAKTAWSEPQVALWLTMAMYGIVKFGDCERFGWMALAGLTAGYAVLTRYDAALYVAGLSVFAVYQVWRQPDLSQSRRFTAALSFGGPLLFFAGLVLGYNYLRYERYLAFSHVGERVAEQMGQASPALDSLEGIVVGVYQHLFSTGKGVLLFSPPMIMFYWAVKEFKKEHGQLALLCVGVPVLVFIVMGAVWGMSNVAWGERYFVPLTLFFILPLAALVSGILDHGRLYMKRSIIILCGAGLAVQMLGIAINFQTVLDKQLARGERPDLQIRSYDPEYSPVLLHFKEALERIPDTWRAVTVGPERFLRERSGNSGDGQASGAPDKARRDIIRFHTFDFWFCYMYFVGVSPWLIGIPGVLLLTIIWLSGRNLLRLI